MGEELLVPLGLRQRFPWWWSGMLIIDITGWAKRFRNDELTHQFRVFLSTQSMAYSVIMGVPAAQGTNNNGFYRDVFILVWFSEFRGYWLIFLNFHISDFIKSFIAIFKADRNIKDKDIVTFDKYKIWTFSWSSNLLVFLEEVPRTGGALEQPCDDVVMSLRDHLKVVPAVAENMRQALEFIFILSTCVFVWLLFRVNAI